MCGEVCACMCGRDRDRDRERHEYGHVRVCVWGTDCLCIFGVWRTRVTARARRYKNLICLCPGGFANRTQGYVLAPCEKAPSRTHGL